MEVQSLEVAKYVWFLLKEIGVSNIPSLAKICNMKFGKLDAQKLIVKVSQLHGMKQFVKIIVISKKRL